MPTTDLSAAYAGVRALMTLVINSKGEEPVYARTLAEKVALLLDAGSMTEAEAEIRADDLIQEIRYNSIYPENHDYAKAHSTLSAALLANYRCGRLDGMKWEAELRTEIERLKGLCVELIGSDALLKQEDRNV